MENKVDTRVGPRRAVMRRAAAPDGSAARQWPLSPRPLMRAGGGAPGGAGPYVTGVACLR